MRSPKIMLIAGEASGDLHGASLVREILRQAPGARLFGLGGPRMRAAGMRLDLDLASRSVIGFFEVLKHLGFFRKAFRLAQDLLLSEKPDLVVPIDYPGFNLRFSAFAAGKGARVCYYISPQVWAWKAGRVRTMKRCLARILVTFPFEEPIYRGAGLPCSFVGHPLMDSIRPRRGTAGVRRARGWGARERLVGLLPGSREQEILYLLPVMLDSAVELSRRAPDARFVVLKAPHLKAELFEPLARRYSGKIRLEILQAGPEEDPYELRRCFDAAMVASGTATLETAILGTPFVILYRVNPLSYQIGKRLIRLPYIGLANVVAGRKVVEEFIQHELKPEKIAEALWPLLSDPAARREQTRALKKAVRGLGGPGAARRAAREILNLSISSKEII